MYGKNEVNMHLNLSSPEFSFQNSYRGRTAILREKKSKQKHKIIGKKHFFVEKKHFFNTNFKYKYFSNDYCKIFLI